MAIKRSAPSSNVNWGALSAIARGIEQRRAETMEKQQMAMEQQQQLWQQYIQKKRLEVQERLAEQEAQTKRDLARIDAKAKYDKELKDREWDMFKFKAMEDRFDRTEDRLAKTAENLTEYRNASTKHRQEDEASRLEEEISKEKLDINKTQGDMDKAWEEPDMPSYNRAVREKKMREERLKQLQTKRDELLGITPTPKTTPTQKTGNIATQYIEGARPFESAPADVAGATETPATVDIAQSTQDKYDSDVQSIMTGQPKDQEVLDQFNIKKTDYWGETPRLFNKNLQQITEDRYDEIGKQDYKERLFLYSLIYQNPNPEIEKEAGLEIDRTKKTIKNTNTNEVFNYETGEPVGVKAPSATARKPEELSFAGNIAQGWRNMLRNIDISYGGTMQAIDEALLDATEKPLSSMAKDFMRELSPEDKAGTLERHQASQSDFVKWLKDDVQTHKQLNDESRQYLEQHISPTAGMDFWDSLKTYIKNPELGIRAAIESAPQTVAGMATTVATKNPYLGWAIMSGQGFGNRYLQERDKGYDVWESAANAAQGTMIESAIEEMSILPQLGWTKSLTKLMASGKLSARQAIAAYGYFTLRGGLVEGSEELTQGLADSLQSLNRGEITADQLLKGLGEQTVAGGAAGLFMAGIMGLGGLTTGSAQHDNAVRQKYLDVLKETTNLPLPDITKLDEAMSKVQEQSREGIEQAPETLPTEPKLPITEAQGEELPLPTNEPTPELVTIGEEQPVNIPVEEVPVEQSPIIQTLTQEGLTPDEAQSVIDNPDTIDEVVAQKIPLREGADEHNNVVTAERINASQRIKDIVQGEEEQWVKPLIFGDFVSTPDGKVGILRGSGGLGSDRVKVVKLNGEPAGFYNRDELKLIKREEAESKESQRASEWLDDISKKIQELKTKNEKLLLGKGLYDRFKRAVEEGQITNEKFKEKQAKKELLSDKEYKKALEIEKQIEEIKQSPIQATTPLTTAEVAPTGQQTTPTSVPAPKTVTGKTTLNALSKAKVDENDIATVNGKQYQKVEQGWVRVKKPIVEPIAQKETGEEGVTEQTYVEKYPETNIPERGEKVRQTFETMMDRGEIGPTVAKEIVQRNQDVYTQISNAETRRQVADIINNNGIDRVEEIALNAKENDLTITQEATLLGGITLYYDNIALTSPIGSTEHENAWNKRHEFAMKYLLKYEDIARALQLRRSSILELAPDIGLNEYRKMIEQLWTGRYGQEKTNAVFGTQKALSDAIATSIQDALSVIPEGELVKGIDKLAKNKQAQNTPIWQRYRQYIADQIIKSLYPGQKPKIPIREFSQRIIKAVKDLLPKHPKMQSQYTDDYAIVQEIIKNPDRYREALDTVLRAVQNEAAELRDKGLTADNNAKLDKLESIIDILNFVSENPFSSKRMDNLVGQTFKLFNIALGDLVRQDVKNKKDVGKALGSHLISDMGLNSQEARAFSQRFYESYQKLIKERSIKILDSMQMALSKSTSKERNSFIKSMREFKNLGAFKMPEYLDVIKDKFRKAIRNEILYLGLKSAEIAKKDAKEVDDIGNGIINFLTAQTDMERDDVAQWSDTMKEIFNEEISKAKQGVLDARLKALQKEEKKFSKSLYDKLRELINLGALDDAKYFDVVQKAIGLPLWDDAVAKEIQRRSDIIRKEPAEYKKNEMIHQLWYYIANQVAPNKTDIYTALAISGMLSGINTQAINIISTAENVLLEAITLSTLHPSAKSLKAIWGGLLDGIGRGMDIARRVLQKGTTTELESLNQAVASGNLGKYGRVLERVSSLPLKGQPKIVKPGIFLAKGYKYVGRAMGAADAIFKHGASEMKARLVAIMTQRQNPDIKPNELWAKTEELLGEDDASVQEAQEQATNEGNQKGSLEWRLRVYELINAKRPQDLVEDAQEFGLRVTYNDQKAKGILGHLSEGLAKWGDEIPGFKLFVAPFTRIVTNVLNEQLNYTPIGYARYNWGRFYKQAFENEYYKEQMAKATMGIMLTAGILTLMLKYKDDDDPLLWIWGSGTGDPDKDEQLGIKKNSIKLGRARIPYLDSPLGGVLAFIGNYADAYKYRKLDEQSIQQRLAYVAKSVPKTLLDLSLLRKLNQVLDRFSQPSATSNAPIIPGMISKVRQLAVPAIVRNINGWFDPKQYKQDTIREALLRDFPVARSYNRPMINSLGDIVGENRPVSERVFYRFISWRNPDPVYEFLAEHQVYVSPPGMTTLVWDSKLQQRRRILPEEYYEYVKDSGKNIKEKLKGALNNSAYANMPREELQDKISDMVEKQRESAKKRLQYKINNGLIH